MSRSLPHLEEFLDDRMVGKEAVKGHVLHFLWLDGRILGEWSGSCGDSGVDQKIVKKKVPWKFRRGRENVSSGGILQKLASNKCRINN